ncbi:MAG: hypothetical protein P0S95_03275 [Rhabdochlamydiaceae bacterium]|nr:hypothetical protein [Candidatus Amphrikana amoebophyrae]
MTPLTATVSKEVFLRMPNDMPETGIDSEYHSTLTAIIGKIGDILSRPAKYGAELLGHALFHLTPGKSNNHFAIIKIALKFSFGTIGLTLAIASSPAIAVGMLLKTVVSFDLKNIQMSINETILQKTLKVGEETTFSSYNTGLMCGLFSNVNQTRNPEERSREIASKYGEKDRTYGVASFQEVLDKKARSILCNTLSSKYRYVMHNAFPTEWGLDAGLVMATNFKPVAVMGIRFTNGSGDDSMMNKGAIITCLQVDTNKYILVANTHLQAKDDAEGSDFYTNKRKAQLTSIKNKMKDFKTKLEKEGYNIGSSIVMGDLNMSSEAVKATGNLDSVNDIRDSSFYDLEHENSTWGSETINWNKNVSLGESLDYCHPVDGLRSEASDFTLKHTKEVVEDFVTPDTAHSGSSDHLPLLTTFKALSFSG